MVLYSANGVGGSSLSPVPRGDTNRESLSKYYNRTPAGRHTCPSRPGKQVSLNMNVNQHGVGGMLLS